MRRRDFFFFFRISSRVILGVCPMLVDYHPFLFVPTVSLIMQIGQGTYSSVYKARDLETNKIVALKKVRFANMDPESVRFMAREIIIMRRLDHPNVMKLEGLITSRVSGSLYLVFEYMEHDLAGLAATSGIKFTEAQVLSLILLIKWL